MVTETTPEQQTPQPQPEAQAPAGDQPQAQQPQAEGAAPAAPSGPPQEERRGGRGVIRLGQQHQTASPLDQYAHLQGVTDLSSVHWW